MFYFDEINGKKILKSSVLSGLNHFFTTRESFIFTKDPEFEGVAAENKKDICRHLNINASDLIHPSQTHSSNIDIAKAGVSCYPDTDGLILTNFEQAVFLNFADCTPVIIYDPVNKAAAVSHAGWRGTAAQIAYKTVQKMSSFGSVPENMKAAIGPAISYCCYNVGEDVYRQLMVSVRNSEKLSEIRQGSIFVDLKGINKRQLIEAGLKVENIDVCPFCTVCNNELFFSYRKENGTTNRHSAVVKL